MSHWTSLAGYLAHAEKHGVSQNVASYIGATTLRIYAVGQDDRPATAAELDTMRGLVRDEMSAGALGIGSSLIYPPAFFASTEELIALCAAAAPYDGKYISHMRDEGNALLEAIDELLRISREAGVPAEIYHLKQAGRRQLAQARRRHREGRRRARERRAHHGRHVHLHGRRDRPLELHPAALPRRRPAQALRAPRGSRCPR